jgi:hypothetical protein
VSDFFMEMRTKTPGRFGIYAEKDIGDKGSGIRSSVLWSSTKSSHITIDWDNGATRTQKLNFK